LDEKDLKSRQDAIHNKGFDLFNFSNFNDDEQITEYGRMKVGVKQLEDAIINIGSLRGLHIKYCDK
jgi:hypothetical protein